jgi:hypothetical protein
MQKKKILTLVWAVCVCYVMCVKLIPPIKGITPDYLTLCIFGFEGPTQSRLKTTPYSNKTYGIKSTRMRFMQHKA